MLRINLLPSYLGERKKVRTAIAAVIVLFVAVVGAGLFLNYGPGQLVEQQKAAEQKATDEEAEQKKEQDFEAATGQIRSAIGPLNDKVNFVEAVRYHNIIRQKIYRQAAAYTYKDIELNGMSVNGNTLAMSAYAKSVADIGRFYIYMFGNPDVTAVSITGVPGYTDVLKQTPVTFPGGPPPLPAAYHISLVATLVKPVSAPQLPGSLNAGGPSGGGGGGGAPAPPPPSGGGGPGGGGSASSSGSAVAP